MSEIRISGRENHLNDAVGRCCRCNTGWRNQKIEPKSDGNLLVSAAVADTSQVPWCLLALGKDLEVLGPLLLPKKIALAHQNAAQMYCFGSSV